MSKQPIVVLEKKSRLSRSILWEYQKSFFDDKGVQAWVSDVPYYITSNPFIAHSYAQIVLRAMLAWRDSKQCDLSEPFYVVELGTGAGKFSFYFLKALMRLMQAKGFFNINFRYVMTDFTDENINYWSNHASLQPFVDSGRLDFASFDVNTDTEISLRVSDETLKPGGVKNPMVLFANYLFDTVPHDAFYVSDGTLYESDISIQSEKSNLINKKPIKMSELCLDFTNKKVGPDYYDDEVLNSILETYRATLNSASFLIPVAGIDAINKVRAWSSGRLLVVGSDKAYIDIGEFEGRTKPHLAHHGSFSMMVNFDAISRYTLAHGGQSYLQPLHAGIKTCVFLMDPQMSKEYNIAEFSDLILGGFNPARYFSVYKYLSAQAKTASLDVLIGLLSMSMWDPKAFVNILEYVVAKIDEVSTRHRAVLDEGIKRVADNYYYIPNSRDVMFDVAYYFQMTHQYDLSQKYYERSIGDVGEQFSTLFNMALCAYEMGHLQEANQWIDKSLALSPESTEAIEWRDHIRSHIQQTKDISE